MKKRLLALITGAALVGTLLAGGGSTSENTESPERFSFRHSPLPPLRR